MKIGDKIKFKHPDIWDNKEHTILNVQRTHGDMCYFLHYWSWIDEDELVLVDISKMDKVKVGDYFNDGTLSKIVRIEDDNAFYNDKDRVPVEYAFQHRVSVIEDNIKEDVVQTPTHYNSTSITALQVIDDWNLDFYLGNVVKYIARNDKKGTQLQDLKKAADYLNMFITKLENVGKVRN